MQSGVDVKLAKSILEHLEWLLGSNRLCHQEACCVCVREGLLSVDKQTLGISFALEFGKSSFAVSHHCL